MIPPPLAAYGLSLPVNHAERGHHHFGMSKLNYLDGCPGFTSKKGTTQAAEDGTRLHEIMDKVVAFHADLKTLDGTPAHIRMSALQCLALVLSTDAVDDAEIYYLEYCCKELDFWLGKKPIRVLREENVSVRNHDGTELNHGYYDVAIFLSETKVVVLDWKFGWVPVPPAEQNLQGMGYSVGIFQKYPRVDTVGFIFAQPKLNKTTRCSYSRAQLPEMFARVKGVINRALSPEKQLKVGQYCGYCAVAEAGTCTAMLNEAARAVAVNEGLPMPTTFSGLQIETPEDAARALYVVQRLEVLVAASGLKEKAAEFARNNGGCIEAQISPTEKIIVEVRQRNAARSVNSPALIAEVLKDVLTPEEVLSCCDPKITRLEELFAEKFTEQRAAEAQKVIADAEKNVLSGICGPSIITEEQKKIYRAEAKAKAKELRVTKKQACEILASTLSAEGLLSDTGGKVDYLKTRIEKQTKTLKHTN